MRRRASAAIAAFHSVRRRSNPRHMANLHSTNGTTNNMQTYREHIKYKLQNAREILADRQKLFAAVIRLELGYDF
jgi:hypothetical protein